MKVFGIFLTLVLLNTCSQQPNENANIKANLAAKNKETATRNSMVRLVQDAQNLEQEGRAMDIYRQFQSPINIKACAKVLAEKSGKIDDFRQKMEAMPESYKNRLVPIFEDLNKCVACEKKAIESCKTARANINQLIKDVFPN